MAIRTLVCLAVSASAVIAAPPRVIRAVPDNADEFVAATTTEMLLEFDQDMNPAGWSICGGGPRFPAPAGRPSWKTPRRLSIPVTLEPGHTYSFSANCPAAHKFRSAAGEPAIPYPIQFSTAKAGEDPPPPPTLEQNRAAIQALRAAINDRYSHKDRRVKDWDALFEPITAPLEESRTRAQFARIAAGALAPAEDVHLNFRAGPFTLGTCTTAAQPNFTLDAIQRSVPSLAWKNSTIAAGRFDDGVGYILITAWPSDPQLTSPAHEALTEMLAAPAIIIDVRPNGGGDELAARRFASRFARSRAVYSRDEFRDPEAPSGFGPMLDRIIEPSDASAYHGRVAVLIGPTVVSSCESFVLMMKTSPSVTLIGATTRGSSGNPQPIDLGNGVTLLTPSWRDYQPDGTPLEGRGIDPVIAALPGDPAATDGVIAAARAALGPAR